MGCGCHSDGNCRLYLEAIIAGAVDMALEDTDESWKEIEKECLPKIMAYKYHNTIAERAIELYQRPEGPVRDLAATITAEIKIKEVKQETLDELKEYTLKGIVDEHKYARFRATIATIKQGWYGLCHVTRIKETLKDIIKTEQDLAALANNYLKKIK